MGNEGTECPKCGGHKPYLMACVECGYSYRSKRLKRRCEVCPLCGANASQEHIDRKDCFHLVTKNKAKPKLKYIKTKYPIFDDGGSKSIWTVPGGKSKNK